MISEVRRIRRNAARGVYDASLNAARKAAETRP
jgi:hypothetical protein